MKKTRLTKLLTLFFGLSLTLGVLVGVSSNKVVSETKAETITAASWSRTSGTKDDVVTEGSTIYRKYVNSYNSYFGENTTTGNCVYVGLRKNSDYYWESSPAYITLTATIGASEVSDLENNVYAVFLDKSGGEIEGSETLITSSISSTSGEVFSVQMPSTSNVAGFIVKHVKEESCNLRYYNLILSYNSGVLPTAFTISKKLTGITISGTDAETTSVNPNGSYSVTLNSSTYCSLPTEIEVTMGGTTLINGEGYLYNNTSGELLISDITGNVEITAEAVFGGSFELNMESISSYTGADPISLIASNSSGFSSEVIYTFVSNSPSIVTVSNKETNNVGVVTIVGVGSTTISVTASDGFYDKTISIPVEIIESTHIVKVYNGDTELTNESVHNLYYNEEFYLRAVIIGTGIYEDDDYEKIDVTREALLKLEDGGTPVSSGSKIDSGTTLTVKPTGNGTGKRYVRFSAYSSAVKIIFDIRTNPYGKYSLVTSTDQLSVGSNYLITTGKAGTVYVTSTNNTTYATDRIAAAQEEVSTYGRIKITAEDETMPFELFGTESAYEFKTYNYAGGDGYLDVSSSESASNRTLQVTNVSSDYTKFNISFNDDKSANLITNFNSKRSYKKIGYYHSGSNDYFNLRVGNESEKVYLFKQDPKATTVGIKANEKNITDLSAIYMMSDETKFAPNIPDGVEAFWSFEGENLSMVKSTDGLTATVSIDDITVAGSGTLTLEVDDTVIDLSVAYEVPQKEFDGTFIIKNKPTKSLYVDGDYFNPSGLVITLKYKNPLIYPNEDVSYDEYPSRFAFNVNQLVYEGEDEGKKIIRVQITYTDSTGTIINNQLTVSLFKTMVDITDITISTAPNMLDAFEHESAQMSFTYKPSNTTMTNVTWSVDNETIVYTEKDKDGQALSTKTSADYIQISTDGIVTLKEGVKDALIAKTLPFPSRGLVVWCESDDKPEVKDDGAVYLRKHGGSYLSYTVAEEDGTVIKNFTNYEYGKTYLVTVNDASFPDEDEHYTWKINAGSSLVQFVDETGTKITNPTGKTVRVNAKAYGSTKVQISAYCHDSDTVNLSANVVYQPVQSLVIDQGSSFNLDYNKSQTFTATLLNEYADPTMTWSIETDLIEGTDYTFDFATNTLTSKTTDGVVTVVVTAAGNVRATCDVTIGYVAKHNKFNQISENQFDASKEYLIINNRDGFDYCFDGSKTSQTGYTGNNNYIKMNTDGTKIVGSDALADSTFKFIPTDGGYYMLSKSGYYIGNASDKEGITSTKTEPVDIKGYVCQVNFVNEVPIVSIEVTSTPTKLTKAVNDEGETTTLTFGYRKVGTTNKFGFYSSDVTPINLYQLDTTFKSAYDFAGDFLNAMRSDGVCSPTGDSNLENVKTAWNSMLSNYGGVDETERLGISRAEAIADSENDIESMLYVYDYIYSKYGATLSLENFLNRSVSSSVRYGVNFANVISENNVILIAVISFVGLTTVAGFVFYKKHKEN